MLSYLITVSVILFFCFLIWSTSEFNLYIKGAHFFLSAFALYESLNLMGKISMPSEPKSIITLSILWFLGFGIIYSNVLIRFFFFILAIWGVITLI